MKRLALTLCLTLATGAAAAQTPPAIEARDRFSRGVALYSEGNAGAALTEFLRAYELLGRRASLLFNIAVTHEALGHYVEALAAMREFSERAPASAIATHRVEMEAALTRLPTRIGTLRVDGSLEGLAVTIDGESRAIEALRTGVPLSAGSHRVVMRAAGRLPREVDVRVAGGEVVGMDTALEAAMSSIAIRCDVPDAEVRIDGRAVGVTPLASSIEVSTGRHTVELGRAGYATFTRDVDARGLGASVDASLTWAEPIDASVAARVEVETNERGAVTLLDGRRFEALDAVPSGRHVLRVTRGSFQRWERDVTLSPREVLRVRAWLDPTPSFREGWISDVRARRTVSLSFGISGAVATVAGAVLTGLFASSLSDSSARVDQAEGALVACERTACDASMSERIRSDRVAANDDLYRDRVGLTVGVGVAAVGVAALVTGIVLWSRAGSPRRFDRVEGYETSAR